MKALKHVAAGTALFLSSWAATAGVTFDSVKARLCVSAASRPAWPASVNDSKGGWVAGRGLCRALAITMFGDPNQDHGRRAVQRFTALQSGEVDAAVPTPYRSPATPRWA